MSALQIQTSIGRLRLYLERVERDLAKGDRAAALANLAELGEISRRLWNALGHESITVESEPQEGFLA